MQEVQDFSWTLLTTSGYSCTSSDPIRTIMTHFDSCYNISLELILIEYHRSIRFIQTNERVRRMVHFQVSN